MIKLDLAGLVFVTSSFNGLTIDPNEELIRFIPHKTDSLTEYQTQSAPRVRSWKSRDGLHYKRTKLGEEVFGGFESALNPVLEQVIVNHPRGKELLQMRDANKVEISHHMVPMRDGVKLSTIVINPLPADQKKSTMISRSPYGPTSDQIADIFLALNGFAAVIQDQRGTFLSEGYFSMWHDDSKDGYDTLAWIAAQPWSNGKVFSSGISADGCGSAAMILSEPPQLKGQLIMWASMDGHETSFPGGVFREGLVGGWMTLMSPLTRGYSLENTLPDILEHEELSDWWTPIQGPGHYHQAKWPTIHIAAWWDIFAGHHINLFNGINQFAGGEHHLFVGPLGHCLLGNADAFLTIQESRGIVNAFGLASEVFGETPVEQSVFRKKVKRINVFVQGSRVKGQTGGNYWSSVDAWPEPQIHRLLLGSESGLRLEPLTPPASYLRRGRAQYKEGYAEYTYDPIMPMITNGGNNLILTFLGMGCGGHDQRKAERRNDVLIFTTAEELAEPLVLMGQMKAVLYVSTDRPDTDFFVSVTDVHPTGESMQIRYGMRRMRWRDSTPFKSVLTKTEPDTVYRIEIDLWFTSYIVNPGHRLRVMIGSSNTPYYAKNDNSGQDKLGFKYNLPSVNRIYWSEDYPSHIELPVVSMDAIPKNEHF